MYYEKNNCGEVSVGSFYIILSTEGNECNTSNSFYNEIISVVLSQHEMMNAAIWCETYCKDEWIVGCNSSAFVNEEDAMAFKLAWI